jgi:hypothetical protein
MDPRNRTQVYHLRKSLLHWREGDPKGLVRNTGAYQEETGVQDMFFLSPTLLIHRRPLYLKGDTLRSC